MADLEQIADLLARARQFCASVPMGEKRVGDFVEGDARRFVVPSIINMCDLIPGEIHFAAALPAHPDRERMVAESEQRLQWMLGTIRELLYQAQALELAQEIGTIRAKRSRGGKLRAEENKEAATQWQKKITPEVRRLLDARMSAENIGKRLSARAGRDAETVARFARSLKKKSGK